MTVADSGLRARLYFLELGSPDPAGLAAFYGDVFGGAVVATPDGFAVRDAERSVLVRQGEAKSLLGAGFCVQAPEMLDGLTSRLTQAGVAYEELPQSPLYAAGAVRFRDPDGHAHTYGVAQNPPSARPGLPGRLQHVVVGSTDAARMAAFHNAVVGLRISDRVLSDDGVMRTAFLRSDDEHHSLAVFQTSTNRLDHHCYETTGWGDLKDWGDHLAARHIRIEWGPGRHGPGNNLFLFFYDADGNFLEISAELEVVPAGKPIGDWPHAERTLNSWGRGFLRT